MSLSITTSTSTSTTTGKRKLASSPTPSPNKSEMSPMSTDARETSSASPIPYAKPAIRPPSFRSSTVGRQIQTDDWILPAVHSVLASAPTPEPSNTPTIDTVYIFLLHQLLNPALEPWRIGFSRIVLTEQAIQLTRAGLDAAGLAKCLIVQPPSDAAVMALFRFVHLIEDNKGIMDMWTSGIQLAINLSQDPWKIVLSTPDILPLLRDVEMRVSHKVLVEIIMRHLIEAGGHGEGMDVVGGGKSGDTAMQMAMQMDSVSSTDDGVQL
ncbi:hypothetical protein BCR33DRAFT_712817 [Rhizoclosmatium globosum]|uniref:Uncharacterized protein n=1 Tax=Rhizoclosmatium globosum TaxID=329046 RepID=A0A1Y2CV00_9FUNG|nr:hypothetical protein BCR33DRAFT_712817 [Rhizoclosmatium globosum]|eukprot:ORY50842.1 hypothetical protein BCR33DRAFT_712817 [Rhizoclosmatium globosum]